MSSSTTSLKNSVLGIGNPLLDISAEVPKSLLDKYGLDEKTAVLAEEKHLPLYAELVASHKVQYIAGGATQNSIRAAQWMLNSAGNGDGATHYIGCVGDDAYGEQLASAAKSDGVDVHYLKDTVFPTGACAVLVRDKDRTLVANLGAANHYKKTHLELDEIDAIVRNAQLYYASGFFVTVSPESLIAIGEHAAEQNKPFMFNIAAEFLVAVFSEQLDSVMPFVDVLFANEVEMLAYGKAKGFGDDLKEITVRAATQKKTNGKRKRIVVTTRGPESAYVSVGGGDVIEHAAVKVPADEIVDVNGAGDAFVGGFISQFVQEHELATCMRAGHYAASHCVRQSGAAFPGNADFK
jgi:adenosine kinase